MSTYRDLWELGVTHWKEVSDKGLIRDGGRDMLRRRWVAEGHHRASTARGRGLIDVHVANATSLFCHWQAIKIGRIVLSHCPCTRLLVRVSAREQTLSTRSRHEMRLQLGDITEMPATIITYVMFRCGTALRNNGHVFPNTQLADLYGRTTALRGVSARHFVTNDGTQTDTLKGFILCANQREPRIQRGAILSDRLAGKRL